MMFAYDALQCIMVTWHEKTMLMYTKYTSLHYLNYLNFCASFTTFVNCIEFIIAFCTITIRFIDTLSLDKKLLNSKSKKVVKFCVHISTVFSCWVTIIIILLLLC